MAIFPNAASNVYKEKNLKSIDLDVWYLNAWIALFQSMFGLISIPTVAIPFPQPAAVITFQEMGSYLVDSSKCFFLGVNSRNGDDCAYVAYIFFIYLAFNIGYNVCMLVIFKRGSAVLFTIASTARLPLTSFLFQVRFLAGSKTVTLTIYDYFALVIIVIGIIMYRYNKELKREDIVEKIPEAEPLLQSTDEKKPINYN